MSGTGQNSNAAPTTLTPIAVDQPTGVDADGRPVYGSMYFLQMITRILAYLGQPGSSTGGAGGGGGSNLTISEQLTNLENAVLNLQQGTGSAAPGLDGRLSLIERIIGRMPWLSTPTAPVPPADIFGRVNPLPQRPGLSQQQVMARIYFGF